MKIKTTYVNEAFLSSLIPPPSSLYSIQSRVMSHQRARPRHSLKRA